MKRTHDLSELLNYCAGHDNHFFQLLPDSLVLNAYITEGRYPGDLPFDSITENDAREAVHAAERISRIVDERLKADMNVDEGAL